MTVVSLVAFVVIGWGLATRSGSDLVAYLLRLSPSAALARMAAMALVPLYALQLVFVAVESRLESAASPLAWMKALPIPVFEDTHSAPFEILGLALALLQTAALAIVVLRLRKREAGLGVTFITSIACTLAMLSLVSTTMSTTDPYEYVATGLLGFHAYAPAADAFEGTVYAPIANLQPLRGVIYGPLWLVVDVIQTRLGTSIYEKLEAIRVTNVALVAGYLVLLARAGASRATLTGFAINPFLWFYFVANPHADIQGLTLLAAAYGFARRSNAKLATLCLIAAGLIKLPFVLIGGALLTPLVGSTRRWAAWISSIGMVLLISYLVPGPAYIGAVKHYASKRAAANWYPGWLELALLICCASVLIIGPRRKLFGAAWLFQQTAIVISAPWYLCWGVPYALATGTVEVYLVSLPVAAAVLDAAAKSNVALQGVLFLTLMVFTLDAYVSMRHRVFKVPLFLKR